MLYYVYIPNHVRQKHVKRTHFFAVSFVYFAHTFVVFLTLYVVCTIILLFFFWVFVRCRKRPLLYVVVAFFFFIVWIYFVSYLKIKNFAVLVSLVEHSPKNPLHYKYVWRKIVIFWSWLRATIKQNI